MSPASRVDSAAHSAGCASIGHLLAAGEVIGRALVESDHLPDLTSQVTGELWLRDLELTAWRVLHADRSSDDPAGRKAFLEAWTSV
ncbi:hypothetical protein [Streptomyces massasporeus]|uniref:hypothetical protein n=1 Tax=Streptomyces massasporeus TaxID=67324 RepID=UPI0033C8BDCA